MTFAPRGSSAVALGLAACLLCLCGAARAADSADFDRYEIVLQRGPFGPPPANAGLAAEGGVSADGAAADGATTQNTEEPAPVRLTSVTRFGGRPAAGMVHLATNRTLFLREGESIGAYHLDVVDFENQCVQLTVGTNTWVVAMGWGHGQASNIVASAREPYRTVFRPVSPDGNAPVETTAEDNAGADASANVADVKERTKEEIAAEEAQMIELATITDANGEKRISYALLNKLRADAARKRAAAERAEIEAAEAERRRVREEEAEAAKKAEEEKKAEAERIAEEKKKELRANLLQAIKDGEDIEVTEDIELTEEEAEQLKNEGFEL